MSHPSRAAAFAGVLVAAHAGAAAPPARSAKVQELIREAKADVDRLDVAGARDKWAQIYELERSTPALCQLGQLDARLARWEHAATELSQCVAQMPPPRTAVERKRYDARRADLADVRLRVGELHVYPPAGALQVFVDGRQVGGASQVYVAPGQHEVTAVRQDGKMARAAVSVAPGEARGVPLAFDVEKPAAPAAVGRAAPALAPLAAPPLPSPDPWLIAAGTTASTALLVAGVGLYTKSSPVKGDGANGDKCPWTERELDQASAMNHWGTALLITGTALGAATLMYVVLPRGTVIRVGPSGAEVKHAW
jgi:hypothetical protein